MFKFFFEYASSDVKVALLCEADGGNLYQDMLVWGDGGSMVSISDSKSEHATCKGLLWIFGGMADSHLYVCASDVRVGACFDHLEVQGGLNKLVMLKYLP